MRLVLAAIGQKMPSWVEAGYAEYVRRMPAHLRLALCEWLAALDVAAGGPDGLDPALRAEAAACWSLSPLTLPHPLVRVVVAEQLYRAHTLLVGHPYHRSG